MIWESFSLSNHDLIHKYIKIRRFPLNKVCVCRSKYIFVELWVVQVYSYKLQKVTLIVRNDDFYVQYGTYTTANELRGFFEGTEFSH